MKNNREQNFKMGTYIKYFNPEFDFKVMLIHRARVRSWHEKVSIKLLIV
jgi:hypothetical protein